MRFPDPHHLKSPQELNSFVMRAKRYSLFRETPLEVIERWLLGTAWALRPKRIGALPALGALWLKDLVAPPRGLPDPERTWHDNGMCGLVHDLSVDTLVEAYRRGLFTFAHFGPLKWMSLPERCVLFFDEMHTSKRVMRMSRNGKFSVTFDQAFEDVIKACSGRRENKWHVTWITPQIMRTYAALYDSGYVHSFEVWNEQGTLVGGGYGVAIGRVFFTESQFSHESDASKLGFAVLNRHLAEWGYALNDGKWQTPTIIPMGFRNIPRRTFLDLVEAAAEQPGHTGRWKAELALNKPARHNAA
jgi:leucyl/phenylalanyl-tRNA---protein transferase